MSEEWGPWIEHDGRGCPCRGMYVQALAEKSIHAISSNTRMVKVSEYVMEGVASNGGSWSGNPYYNRYLRYRIRKPKGLQILEALLKDLPETVGA